MAQALTCRSLVTAAPVAIVAAAVPASTWADPDAALVGLREPYERTFAIMDEVGPTHARAEAAYFALKTAQPHLDERALRKASGLIPAERAWKRATNANLDVIQRITEQPAHTLAGAVFKAEVSHREGNADLDLMDAIVTDLVAIGVGHA